MVSFIIGIFIIIISGISKAVMDKIQFHYHKSIFKDVLKYNQQFWNPLLSWENKYKEGSVVEPKFMGSTTIFVFLTDAWHSFQMILTLSMFVSVAITSYNCEGPLELIIKVIVLRCFFGLSFEVFFKRIFAAKELPN